MLATQVALAALLLPNTARVAAFFCSDAAAMALTVTMLPVTALNTIGACRQPARALYALVREVNCVPVI